MCRFLSGVGVINSPKIEDKYEKLDKIGTGSQATVYLYRKRKV